MKNYRRLWLFFFLFLISGFACPVHAAPGTDDEGITEKLVNSPERPTMQQVREVAGRLQFPETIPLKTLPPPQPAPSPQPAPGAMTIGMFQALAPGAPVRMPPIGFSFPPPPSPPQMVSGGIIQPVAPMTRGFSAPVPNMGRTRGPTVRGRPGIPGQVPGQAANFPGWLEIMIEGGPKLIAAMEKTFPGATWAFIGRDSQALADLVEGFYLAIGQTNRVVRLGVSKPTFQNLDARTILEFLKDQGLSVKDIDKSSPFIFVDTMSQGFGRQAREMLDAVYEEYARKGGDVAKILRKVNIFGLIVSTFNGEPNPFVKADEILREEEKAISHRQPGTYGQQHKILTFRDPQTLFTEAGYAHYTGAWHETFGPLVRQGERTVAQPGTLEPVEVRMSILWLQRELLRAVETPGFLARVKEEAQKLGYEFPLKRPSPEVVQVREEKPREIPPEVREILEQAKWREESLTPTLSPLSAQQLQQLLQGMQKVPESPEEGLTANGEALLQWYRSAQLTEKQGRLGVEMVKALRAGRKGLRLRGNDLKTILKEVLCKTPLTTSLLGEIRAFSEEAKAMKGMLKSDTWISGSEGFRGYSELKKVLEYSPSCIDELKDEAA